MTENEKRGSDREKCYAKFILTDGRLPGYIRDVSGLGFRIEIPGEVDISVGEKIHASITPVEESEGMPFHAQLEVRWIRIEGPFTAVGMKLLDIDSDQGRLECAKLVHYYDTDLQN